MAYWTRMELGLTPLIQIEGATVFRGATLVFENLSLTIAQRCNVAILGPNGSGKTTLLKVLMREIYPVAKTHSVVRILGESRTNIWNLRSQFGVVSSDLQYSYAEQAMGFETVLSGFHGSVGVWGHQDFTQKEREQAKAVLMQLGIHKLADREYGSLSTGQQRRLLLARCLVNNPQHLLLDEPTSGLDLAGTFEYLATMRSLLKAGRTLLLITHNLNEIPPEIDRLILLKEGRIVADDTKSVVLTEKNLTDLYEQPVKLVVKDGWYQAIPG
ncbi:MAG: molybdenum ABC transporter ATP-binding protein [Acidiferrobacteraceae bacterium]|nr:molybdenum ABC transporter ATP-binding protein [Acidiferrobacteraceae bacterium]